MIRDFVVSVMISIFEHLFRDSSLEAWLTMLLMSQIIDIFKVMIDH